MLGPGPQRAQKRRGVSCPSAVVTEFLTGKAPGSEDSGVAHSPSICADSRRGTWDLDRASQCEHRLARTVTPRQERGMSSRRHPRFQRPAAAGDRKEVSQRCGCPGGACCPGLCLRDAGQGPHDRERGRPISHGARALRSRREATMPGTWQPLCRVHRDRSAGGPHRRVHGGHSTGHTGTAPPGTR